MSRNWFPTTDAELLPFTTNLSTKVTAAPATYGAAVGDATALAALLATFSTALTAAVNPATRTKVTVATKNTAKNALIANLRLLYKKINAANLAADKREELGLPVRDGIPTATTEPVTKPIANVADTGEFAALLRIVDEATPLKKARPGGTEGAVVMSYVQTASEAIPSDLEKWSFKGIAKRSDFRVEFSASEAGKTAHVRLMWFSPRGQLGPASDAVSFMIAA
jgi:hypothetical protein